MEITSAKFIKGIVGKDDILSDGTPQIAFIGRSNAGKSSLLNTLTNSKKLARTSKTPGRTQEINAFLINDTHYFMDLPGYGFAKGSFSLRDKLSDLIGWYLLESDIEKKIVMLIDAEVGPTKDDLGMYFELGKTNKDIIIVANKIDKVKKSQQLNQINKLREQFGGRQLIPFSSKTKTGVKELTDKLLN